MADNYGELLERFDNLVRYNTLPTPTADLRGKVIYLLEEDNGKAPGFYKVAEDSLTYISLDTKPTSGVNYQGVYYPATNTPPIENYIDNGDQFIVGETFTRTINSIVYNLNKGDMLVNNGTDWEQIFSQPLVTAIEGTSGSISKTTLKTLIDLDNVDNTSDADKPISDAAQSVIDIIEASLATKISSGEMGIPLGVATLNASGYIPTNQLPSYVDDVLEFATLAAFPASGAAETGKVYVALNTNVTYRWSGSQYTIIGSDLALGETSSTAYRGDRGKTAYDHSQTTHDKSFVGLGNVDNTSDLNKPVSTAQEAAISGEMADHLAAKHFPYVEVEEIAEPTTPDSGKARLYARDGKFYFKNDAGVEDQLVSLTEANLLDEWVPNISTGALEPKDPTKGARFGSATTPYLVTTTGSIAGTFTAVTTRNAQVAGWQSSNDTTLSDGHTITFASTAEPSWPEWKAFDGNDSSTGWQSVGLGTAILGIRFPTARPVVSYTLKGWVSAALYSPAAWTIEGSNDGVLWTVLDTRSGQTYGGGSVSYPIASPALYDRYQIRCTANQGGPSYVIMSFELYETDITTAYMYSGTSIAFDPTTLEIKQQASIIGDASGLVTLDYSINSAAYTGSYITLAQFKALSVTLFASTSDLKLKIKHTGISPLTSVSIATASTYISLLPSGQATLNIGNGPHSIVPGVANGTATLDSGGKVPASQLPSAIVGSLVYKGTFNPNTGLASGEQGDYYISTASGEASGEVFNPKDWAVFNGTTWDKIDNNEPLATETLPGVIELATEAEVLAATDTQKAVTPATLAEYVRVMAIEVVNMTTDFATLESQTPAVGNNGKWGMVSSTSGPRDADGLYRSDGNLWVKKLDDTDFAVGTRTDLFDYASSATPDEVNCVNSINKLDGRLSNFGVWVDDGSGHAAYPYSQYALVKYNNELYVKTTSGAIASGENPATDTTNWALYLATKSANLTLSNLSNYTTARSNLGLGTAATANIGSASGEVAAGNHTHTADSTKADKFLTLPTVITSNPTLTNADCGKVYRTTGSWTLTLPDGLDAGFNINIIKTDSNATTLVLAATTTLNTKESLVNLKDAYSAVSVVHQGSNVWVAIGDLVA